MAGKIEEVYAILLFCTVLLFLFYLYLKNEVPPNGALYLRFLVVTLQPPIFVQMAKFPDAPPITSIGCIICLEVISSNVKSGVWYFMATLYMTHLCLKRVFWQVEK